MARHESLPEPWFSFLKELDQLVTTTVSLHCIGGFVVTMLYGLSRTTGDLDVLEVCPKSAGDAWAKVAMPGGELHKKYRVCLHHVGVTQPPDDYEIRLQEMFPGTFRRLRLMALDPYDLVLTKLERNIERDRGDVRYLARTVPFDLDILRERYTAELRPYLGNPVREDLTLQFWIEDIEEDRASRSA